jgi:hypothetical protein
MRLYLKNNLIPAWSKAYVVEQLIPGLKTHCNNIDNNNNNRQIDNVMNYVNLANFNPQVFAIVSETKKSFILWNKNEF